MTVFSCHKLWNLLVATWGFCAIELLFSFEQEIKNHIIWLHHVVAFNCNWCFCFFCLFVLFIDWHEEIHECIILLFQRCGTEFFCGQLSPLWSSTYLLHCCHSPHSTSTRWPDLCPLPSSSWASWDQSVGEFSLVRLSAYICAFISSCIMIWLSRFFSRYSRSDPSSLILDNCPFWCLHIYPNDIFV